MIERLRHHFPSIAALGLRGISVVAGFAITYVIGHHLGPAANGQYALVTQTATFLSVLCLLGLDIGVVRHFAKAVADKVRIGLRSLLNVTGLAFGLMSAVSLALYLGGDVLWKPLFGNVVSREMLAVLCIMILGRGGTQLFGALLRSQHSFVLGQAIAVFAIPVTAAAALLTGLVTSVYGAMWVTAGAGIGFTLLGMVAMTRYVTLRGGGLDIGFGRMMNTAIPLWGASLALSIADWYGTAVAAAMTGAEGAGLYRVGVQIAGVLQIISTSLFAVYSARISTAFHANDIAWVGRLTRSATRLSVVLAFPCALMLFFTAPIFTRWIGPEFVASVPVTRVLIIGQLAFTLTGPCGVTLAVSGNERVNLALTVLSTLLLGVSGPIAAHYFGIEGLAACVSLVMVTRNVASFVAVWMILKLNLITGHVRAGEIGSPEGVV